MALIRALAIPGSLRTNSLNRALLEAAVTLAPETMEVAIHGLDGIPLFNRDDEQTGGFPPAVSAIREALAAADAILKNALDWLSRDPDSPLIDKPGAILGAGGRFGTVRAQLHLREILVHSRVDLVLSPQVMIDAASTKFDDDLRLADERHQDQIARLLVALTDLIDRRR